MTNETNAEKIESQKSKNLHPQKKTIKKDTQFSLSIRKQKMFTKKIK